MEQQQQDLIKRLSDLEKRFQDLVKSLEVGSHPWGMINASRVTGALQQEKLSKLKISEQDLVDLYQDYPQVLAAVAMQVGLTANSFREHKPENIYLEKEVNGNYWVIATEPDGYWLVPKNEFKYNDYIMPKVESFFQCEGYQNQSSQNQKPVLAKPAQVSPSPDGERWVLEELGKLDFQPTYANYPLREKLDQLKQEFLDFKNQLLQSIEGRQEKFGRLQQQSEMVTNERQDLEKQVEKLQQQLEIVVNERQDLEEQVEGLQEQLNRANIERKQLEARVEQLFEWVKKSGSVLSEGVVSPDEEKVASEGVASPDEEKVPSEGVLSPDKQKVPSEKIISPQVKLMHTLKGHTDSVSTLGIRSCPAINGKLLIASGSFDKTIRLWNLHTGEWIKTLQEKAKVNKLAMSPHAPILVSGSDRPDLQVWNLEKHEVIFRLNSHHNPIFALAISPDGELLVSGGLDQKINLWKLSTGEFLRTLPEDDSAICCLVISPDGKTLVSSNQNNTIKLWILDQDMATFKRNLVSDMGTIWDTAISPDGKMLACSFVDGLVKILGLETGELLYDLTEHSQDVYQIAFSPDGQLLASGSSDQTVRLWDVKTGVLLHILNEHTSDVFAVAFAFSEDGRFLVSGGKDKLIKVWKLME